MTLIAHWKLGDGRSNFPTTAVDSAAGGSGAHDGSYDLTAGGEDKLYPGGVAGAHLHCTYAGGAIDSIGNPSDLNQLHGALTVMFWVHPWDGHTYYTVGGTREVVSCHKSPRSVEADNMPWFIRLVPDRPIISWQTGPTPVNTSLTCIVGLTPTWVHVAIKRYEVSPGFFAVKFYYDGVLVDTQDNGGAGWAAPTGGANTIPYIGKNDAGYSSYYAHHHLDSIRVYDSEESDVAIAAVHTAEEPLVRPAVELFPLPGTDELLGVSNIYKAREEGPFSPREGAGFTG